jgi:hypothetical protein
MLCEKDSASDTVVTFLYQQAILKIYALTVGTHLQRYRVL